jgi:GNAT superfamily N-acetyltransferase
MPSWSIRAYRNEDERGILELWKAVYPEHEYSGEKWLDYWRWTYFNNPAGKGWIWLAEDDKKIVGQSAIIPANMKIDGERIVSFQSVDTMTHPDYRRQGIYETLAKKVYEEAKNEGVLIGYRFPNENSHPIAIKKLDWFDVATLNNIIKPLNWKNALSNRTSNRSLLNLAKLGGGLKDGISEKFTRNTTSTELTVEQISSFNTSVDELWADISTKYPIVILKNREYLNWRYVNGPVANFIIYAARKGGTTEGYLVLKYSQQESSKVGVVFELSVKSEKIAECLITEVLQRCRKDEVDYVTYQYLGNRDAVKALKRQGFFSVPFVKKDWFCAYTTSPTLLREYLADPEKWLIQIGDSDRE